jgi:hypothetical protein
MPMKMICVLGAGIAIAVISTVYVDAAVPAGRYTTTSTTVYDNKTRLTWQRTVPATAYSWADAKAYCASASVSAILGGIGHLPTIKELATIVDYSANPPKIDLTAFPGTPAEYFWTSTVRLGSTTLAWIIDFDQGPTNYDVVTDMNDVRCVR